MSRWKNSQTANNAKSRNGVGVHKKAAIAFVAALVSGLAILPVYADESGSPSIQLSFFDSTAKEVVSHSTDLIVVIASGFSEDEVVAYEATATGIKGEGSVPFAEGSDPQAGFRVPSGFTGEVEVKATSGSNGSKTAADSIAVEERPSTSSATPVVPLSSGRGTGRSGGNGSWAGKRSGLPWMTGAHPFNGNHLVSYIGTDPELNANNDDKGFEDWLGVKMDVAHVYGGGHDKGADWKRIMKPPVIDTFAAFEGRLVISQPLYPREGGGNNAACANGDYDDEWKAFGTYMVEKNRGDSIIRLAWEFNGGWFVSHPGGDVETWKTCFQKVVTAMKSTAPGLLADWTFNGHNSVPEIIPGENVWDAYPGNDFVDIVGIDPYDHYPPSHTKAEFDAQCNDKHGLCYVIKFAKENGKGVGVGEWGVMQKKNRGGGDNPDYIQWMFDTFKSAAADGVMAYDTIFEEGLEVNNRRAEMPNAWAKYKELYQSAAGVINT